MKPRKELLADILLIVAIQLFALCYGIWNVWQVRPIYLVQEADRFNIISMADIEAKDLSVLPEALKPKLFKGPTKVSLRQLSSIERGQLNLQMKAGGKDASERPLFYDRFHGDKAFQNGRELRELLITQPQHKTRISNLIDNSKIDNQMKLRYLYIVGRNYGIVIINQSGEILEYLDYKF